MDGNARAFFCQNGVMTDLNTLIPADSPLFLIATNSNNSRGQIAGVAFETSTGEVHAFSATPNQRFAASENATQEVCFGRGDSSKAGQLLSTVTAFSAFSREAVAYPQPVARSAHASGTSASATGL